MTTAGRHHMSPEQRDALRAAGRARAADLPELSAKSYQRIAALLAEPINQFVATARRRGGGIHAT